MNLSTIHGEQGIRRISLVIPFWFPKEKSDVPFILIWSSWRRQPLRWELWSLWFWLVHWLHNYSSLAPKCQLPYNNCSRPQENSSRRHLPVLALCALQFVCSTKIICTMCEGGSSSHLDAKCPEIPLLKYFAVNKRLGSVDMRSPSAPPLRCKKKWCSIYIDLGGKNSRQRRINIRGGSLSD